jgi:serine phosphatase RsbU (regulator of sigma subunit)
VLLAVIPSACRQDTTGKPAGDSAVVTRHDSADSARAARIGYELMNKAYQYYNDGQTDSLEAMIPEALQFCRDNGLSERYYELWGCLADEYVFDDEFDKATDEATRMQDTAMKYHDDYGLFTSYSVLGKGYAYKENNEEAASNLRKAFSYFHSPYVSQAMTSYHYYLNALLDQKHYEEADSAFRNWKFLLDRESRDTTLNDATFCMWNALYYVQRSNHLMAQEHLDEAATAIDSCEYFYHRSGSVPINQMLVLEFRARLSFARKDYRAMLNYGSQLYDIAMENDVNSYKILGMDIKNRALEGLNRYRESLATLRELYAYEDSLNKVSDKEKLNELNKRFEVNELKMQAERDKMQAERDKMQAERRQLYLILAIILLAVFGGAFYAFSRYRSSKRLAKLRAVQERIEGELKIARDIQMSMVPNQFPDREGLDMFAAMIPAKEVGGDLYGYVMIGDMLYFAVGDVSGKGVPASLFMAQATRLFRTLAAQGMMPNEICTRINSALSGEDNVNGMFVTMFIGMLDLQSGHLSFCNAGHNPPVIGGGEHNGDFLEMIPNAPIGLWPDLEYEGEEIDSIKDRPLFIYTDGLNEAENPQQEQFGDERLLDILRNTHFNTSQQVIERLKAEVDKHRNGAEPNDDLTMMCLRLSQLLR